MDNELKRASEVFAAQANMIIKLIKESESE